MPMATMVHFRGGRKAIDRDPSVSGNFRSAWVAGGSYEPVAEVLFNELGGTMQKTDQEWRGTLTAEQFEVLRKHGTERPGSSALNHEKRDGTFTCAGCGQLLFTSDTKYESGTGWPSFWKPVEGAVATTTDRSLFMTRVEVHCANCGGHLGHVFPDGPNPTGQRYCMNGVALQFEPKA